MEKTSGEAPKLPDMVMCGDHPSFTKAELNEKEAKPDADKNNKLKDKTSMLSYAKISPEASRTEGVLESRVRAISEHALRMADVRRRRGHDVPSAGKPIAQAFPWATLGSFRWPPYLLCVWVLLLVLTHALHCVVAVLERTLPHLKRFSQYFRLWTEESWRRENDLNQRMYPIALGTLTALLYTLYFALYAVYAVALWAVEPLCPDVDDRSSVDLEAKVTDYEEETTHTNSSVKQ